MKWFGIGFTTVFTGYVGIKMLQARKSSTDSEGVNLDE
jgi:hypothetical protein